MASVAYPQDDRRYLAEGRAGDRDAGWDGYQHHQDGRNEGQGEMLAKTLPDPVCGERPLFDRVQLDGAHPEIRDEQDSGDKDRHAEHTDPGPPRGSPRTGGLIGRGDGRDSHQTSSGS